LVERIQVNRIKSYSNLTEHGQARRLRALALTYHPPTGLSLLKFNRVFPFPDPVIVFDEQFSSLFTPEQRSIYRQAFDWAQAAIDRLISSGEPMHLIHGDRFFSQLGISLQDIGR
jgi:hypothetical protein